MKNKKKIIIKDGVEYELCDWDDLKNDKEQLKIYKEIADINAYMQEKYYQRVVEKNK